MDHNSPVPRNDTAFRSHEPGVHADILPTLVDAGPRGGGSQCRRSQWRGPNETEESLTKRVLCAPERSKPCPACASSPQCGSCFFISGHGWSRWHPASGLLSRPCSIAVQGVDLFFMPSGFVLTWNYLDRMGESFSIRSTLHFLWLRLARVWPVYLVTLHLALAWIIFTLYVGHLPSPVADQLSAVSYARQVLLVQMWFQPFFDGSSWDGPAWSISAEWLAYLLFGG